ncbi:MAG: DNA polymerase IV [Oscillospiraceae bacterium]|nr:DNA polymerase IV [Oscillospiraceae bacterium]
MDRLIFHVDVNSAFLSWEAARRISEGGRDIRNIPSCISGDPSERTSVVLAKSIPAKKYGIKTGEPISAALRKCPDLYIAGPDFKLYRKCSKAFKDICRKYAPVVEEFSIDECFLDMTGTGRVYPDPIATAYEIKDTIRDSLGFTVNIGVGSNKLLAKTASDFEKPDKVHTLFTEEIPDKLWPLPVSDLFMVGRSAREKLERKRIFTIGDLAHLDLKFTQRILGVKIGTHLHEYANGIDHSEVSDEPKAAKGYNISTTFNENVTDTEQANKALLTLADTVSARMRKDNVKAMCVSVKMRSDTFRNKSRQTVLDEPTDITAEIYETARRLLADAWDTRVPLRLLGISLTKLADGGNEQISLFPDEKREKNRMLDKTVDSIRSRYGQDSVKRGSTLRSGTEIGRKHKAHLEDNENRTK